MLGVDEVVPVSTLAGTTVKLRFRNYWGQVDVDSKMRPMDIGRLLTDLATSLKASQFSLDKAQGEDLDRIALDLGVSSRGGTLTADGMRESLRATLEYRCARCGHPSKMHGRNRGLACTIWGCDCERFVDPPSEQEIAQAKLLAQGVMSIDEARINLGLPPLPKEEPAPASRFEAIALELLKEER